MDQLLFIRRLRRLLRANECGIWRRPLMMSQFALQVKENLPFFTVYFWSKLGERTGTEPVQCWWKSGKWGEILSYRTSSSSWSVYFSFSSCYLRNGAAGIYSSYFCLCVRPTSLAAAQETSTAAVTGQTCELRPVLRKYNVAIEFFCCCLYLFIFSQIWWFYDF